MRVFQCCGDCSNAVGAAGCKPRAEFTIYSGPRFPVVSAASRPMPRIGNWFGVPGRGASWFEVVIARQFLCLGGDLFCLDKEVQNTV